MNRYHLRHQLMLQKMVVLIKEAEALQGYASPSGRKFPGRLAGLTRAI